MKLLNVLYELQQLVFVQMGFVASILYSYYYVLFLNLYFFVQPLTKEDTYTLYISP
jgi:hypothetical protein